MTIVLIIVMLTHLKVKSKVKLGYIIVSSKA